MFVCVHFSDFRIFLNVFIFVGCFGPQEWFHWMRIEFLYNFHPNLLPELLYEPESSKKP